MKNRLETLAEIDNLEDNHCKSCTLVDGHQTNNYCVTKCNVGKKLMKLGDQLLKPKQDKIKAILNKGRNMTTNDILYLVENEIPKIEIRKNLSMCDRAASKMINDILEDEKMKSNFEKVREMSVEGMSVKEIAKELGISTATVYTYRSKAKVDEVVTETERKNEPKNKDFINLQKTHDKLFKDYGKINHENTELKKRNDKICIEISELENKYKKVNQNYELSEKENLNLKQELDELKNDYLVMENKYKQMSNTISADLSINNDEIKALQEIINELTEENKVLKEEGSQLRLRNAELIDEARDELHASESRYKNEKKKHETLFEYVTLASEVI